MSYVVLTSRERDDLLQIFFQLKELGEKYPVAREEAITALRCLKAVHSNAIEDKRVDRIFLQVLLHGAGVSDKGAISDHYRNASTELRGQEEMLRMLEAAAARRQPLDVDMLLQMHRLIFAESCPNVAGRFRNEEVRIKGMMHRPTHHSKIELVLYERLADINYRLFDIKEITPANFNDVLRLSAEAHYLVAAVHPFDDGNGRMARAAGDYVMLVHGFYYDVIMTDYRDLYLDALSECTELDITPLQHFLEYSYLETLRRISGFFLLVKR